jgi:class 3 adenylate cyclase
MGAEVVVRFNDQGTSGLKGISEPTRVYKVNTTQR